MPAGYYRDVPAASPTDPPGAHRIRGPLGVQAARGSAASTGSHTVRNRSTAPRAVSSLACRRASSGTVNTATENFTGPRMRWSREVSPIPIGEQILLGPGDD